MSWPGERQRHSMSARGIKNSKLSQTPHKHINSIEKLIDKHGEKKWNDFCFALNEWFGYFNRVSNEYGYGEFDTQPLNNFANNNPEFINDFKLWFQHNHELPDEIVLYRGTKGDNNKVLTSWTTNRDKAVDFAGDGSVLQRTVKKEDVVFNKIGFPKLTEWCDIEIVSYEEGSQEYNWAETWLRNEDEYIVI